MKVWLLQRKQIAWKPETIVVCESEKTARQIGQALFPDDDPDFGIWWVEERETVA